MNEKIPIRAVVSFGSNISPRRKYLQQALEAVANFPLTRLIMASEAEETDPIGVPDEFSHMKFLNQLAIFETALSAQEFSDLMHKVEDRLGRVRSVRNGPRTADIDLIDFGGEVICTPELTLPHPRAHEREFVMKPWNELTKRLSELK